jgi:hypothetical protein
MAVGVDGGLAPPLEVPAMQLMVPCTCGWCICLSHYLRWAGDLMPNLIAAVALQCGRIIKISSTTITIRSSHLVLPDTPIPALFLETTNLD